MGRGEDEGKAPENHVKNAVSNGFVRSKTDKLMLVPGGPADGFGRRPEARGSAGAALGLGTQGATALKGEVAPFVDDLVEAGKAELGALPWSTPVSG